MNMKKSLKSKISKFFGRKSSKPYREISSEPGDWRRSIQILEHIDQMEYSRLSKSNSNLYSLNSEEDLDVRKMATDLQENTLCQLKKEALCLKMQRDGLFHEVNHIRIKKLRNQEDDRRRKSVGIMQLNHIKYERQF
jgi:hypothetical protein